MWNTIGRGRCLDSNQKEYSWFWSQYKGDFNTVKKECESTKNCVGIEWGEWSYCAFSYCDYYGIVLIDANGLGAKELVHVSTGTGPITSSDPGHHTSATCYAYSCKKRE